MKTSVIITAIICITLLEAFALYSGVDGILLTAVIAAIAGLAGWQAKPPKFLSQEVKGG